MSEKNKIVLAYSGGLDTSVIIRWLQERNYEVITFTANIGQQDELEAAKTKAKELGVKQIFVEDLTEEFSSDYVFPMLRANTLYEGEYLLGTSIARPLIAKHLVNIAKQTGATAIAHGATGKGNDQLRFELGIYALAPELKIIAPWREWQIDSRQKLLEYCDQHNIKVEHKKKKQSPYSMDANLLHISYEGGILEDPWQEPEESMWRWTKSLEQAANQAQYIELEYLKGDVVAINKEKLSPAQVLEKLNNIGCTHGIGRLDMVENRCIGMKSRGCYETPGGTILLKSHRAIESITIDREVAHLKEQIMPKYANLIYNGYWWSPEREMLQVMIDQSQHRVNGKVKLKLYKGNIVVTGRQSNNSLFNEQLASFEQNEDYNQSDAEGFIKINSLRLKQFYK